jgi:hypothetical protein
MPEYNASEASVNTQTSFDGSGWAVVMSVSISSYKLRKDFLRVVDHLPSKTTEVAFFLMLPLASLYTNSSRSCSGAAFSANSGKLLRIHVQSSHTLYQVTAILRRTHMS